MYTNAKEIIYLSRYNKFITVPAGYQTDGATGAIDLCEKAWTVHDWICDKGIYDDGTPVTAWQGATIYYDILRDHNVPWWRANIRRHAVYWAGQEKLKGSPFGVFKRLA